MDLFRKFIQFAIGNGVVLILGVISSPIITRMITPEDMGKYSMFNTVSNLLVMIILFGVDQSYVRFFYEEKEENRKKLLRRCISIPLFINIILGILMIVLNKPISKFILGEESIILIILIIVQITSSIISRFALLNIRMNQKAKLYSFLNIISKFSYLILIILVFFIYKSNYMTLIISTIASNIIMSIIAIIIESKEWFNNSKNSNIKTSTKEIIRYGMPFIFSMAITWLLQSIDKIAIKEICGYTEVGIYSGAMSIVGLLNVCQSAFTTFWTPVAYERYLLGNKENFFIKMNKIVSVAMLIIAICLITGKEIIVILLGKEYRQAVYIFPYLVFMPIMYTISETTVLGINFKKKTEKHIYIAAISAIFNVIGNLILVPKYGAKGAAISTGLSYVVFFICRTYFSRKYYKVNYCLGRFFISICMTYLLATYSSFKSIDINILILTITTIGVIIFMYKDIFIEAIELIKNRKLKKISATETDI